MSDYDMSGAYTALLALGIAIGAIVVILIAWLSRHLVVTVGWV